MTEVADQIQLEETAKGGRYFITMPNGELSHLTFVHAGDGHIIADQTFVPPLYRGDGIGEALVERLFSDAHSRGVKITPTCWFVADEFQRHSPKWNDVRA